MGTLPKEVLREMIDIAIDKLSVGAKEDDILIIEGEDIRIDIKETENRKKKIYKLLVGTFVIYIYIFKLFHTTNDNEIFDISFIIQIIHSFYFF